MNLLLVDPGFLNVFFLAHIPPTILMVQFVVLINSKEMNSFFFCSDRLMHFGVKTWKAKKYSLRNLGINGIILKLIFNKV